MRFVNIYSLSGLAFFILTWLLVGIYRDDEFFEPDLFTKYRPTTKVFFHSPIGMQGLETGDLPEADKKEEIAFTEFVIHTHIQNNGHAPFWYMPFVLIQLTISAFCFGLTGQRPPAWKPLVHFAACLVVTFMGLAFLLSFDNLYLSVFGGFIILMFNAVIAMLMTRKKTEHAKA